MRVYLTRHGKPSSTWGGDDADPGLDETGKAQARAVAERLMALPPAERPTRVVSSPLRRCQETARPTAEALGVEIEIDPAVGEIPTPAALAEAERPEWLRQAFGGEWAQIQGDLDYEDWRKRVANAVRSRPGAAIFSHFVAINGVVSLLAGDPKVLAFRPDHCSTSVFESDGETLRLVERGAEAVTGVL